jgi:hypothetical protein
MVKGWLLAVYEHAYNQIPCGLDPDSGRIYPAQAHFAQKNGGGFRSRYFTDFVEISLAVCPKCQRYVCRLLPGPRGKDTVCCSNPQCASRRQPSTPEQDAGPDLPQFLGTLYRNVPRPAPGVPEPGKGDLFKE